MLPTATSPGVGQRRQLQLSDRAGAAVGLVLVVVLTAPLPFTMSKLAGFQYLSVQLGFIGAVYFGFAVAQGSLAGIVLEFLVAGTFMFVGTIALWTGAPLVLAFGYAAHGTWDLVHHTHTVTTPVRNWYPPFCVVFDWAVVAFVLAWLSTGKVT